MSTESIACTFDAYTDAELLESVRQDGDRAAMTVLIKRHHRLVKGVCDQLLSNRHDSDDAYQVTFMLLIRNAKSIRHSAAIPSWLYSTSCRIARRIRQQRARHASLDFKPVDGRGSDPWEVVAMRDQHAALHSAVAQLPDALRRAVVLRYLLGHTNQQVAAQLSISESAVEGRLKRAKARLRNQLVLRGTTLTALFVSLPIAASNSEAAEQLVEGTVDACLVESAPGPGQVKPLPDSLQTLVNQELKAMVTRQFAKFATCVGLAVAVVGVTLIPKLRGTAVAATPVSLATDPSSEQSNTDPISLAPVEPVVEEQDFSLRGVSKSERAIRRALRVETRIDFVDTPLAEAISYLGQMHNLQFAFDQPALDEVGLGTDTPVSATFSGISLDSALTLTLRKLGLTFIIRDEVLTITTPEAAASHTTIQLYPFNDNWPIRIDELVEAIEGGISPDTWHDVGGEGFMMSYENGLVVSQSQAVHQQIVELLEQLNRQATGR